MLRSLCVLEILCLLAKIFNSKKVQVSFHNRNSMGLHFSLCSGEACSSSCLISTLNVIELMKKAES
jgi:hypothetical protein